MKVAFKTLGCKVNSYESDAVALLLEEKGYEIVSYDETSDIYIINTCMVTNTAEAKSRQEVRKIHRLNPDAIIVVMGCLTQLKAEEILEIEGVSVVLGTARRDEIADFIEEYIKVRKPLNKAIPLVKEEKYDNLQVTKTNTHTRAFLKIQDGCNNFCTYCIIPYTRGRVRSKALNDVVSEAKALVMSGHYEIILTGIHTGGYGSDLEHDTFASLLAALENVEGLKRIRISSIEITELDEEVLNVISKSTKIVNHLHIPIQGGTNRILKLMNRKYTVEQFEEKIKELRTLFPNLAITTDIIVGFPTETDQEHEETLELIKRIGFSELHVFPYSKRNGTVSAKMKGEVPGDIKKERVHHLLTLSDELAKLYIKSEIGKTEKVICETYHNGMLIGHTSNYIKVELEGPSSLIGEEVPVVLLEEAYPLSKASRI